MQENFFIFFVHKIAARWDYVCEGVEWFGPAPKQGNTHEMKTGTMKAALLAALSGLTFAASAADFDLATPSASEYPDTESSVNVAVTNWPALGRRVKLTLSAEFTPSNGVQVAFGQDDNADGDLEPGETRVVFGVDCGEPFTREEFGQWRSEMNQGSPSTFTFAFRQPSAVTNRLTHAKVTTHNLADTNLVVAVEIHKPGQVLFLR